ncbi:MAG: prepilin-type N-terminal cleavage/methylation domain-containing protein, partial [Nitrospirae bacterium]|nr:prepilin-type N-terminal cleavage/methylation domain-containing protein [Fimbriimonadaceae bacterium]
MKRAFTLIELLVVIAIIAILAAMLFPVYAQAKTAAQKTTVISNTKQAGTAMLMYLSDNDDAFPSMHAIDPITNTVVSGPVSASGLGPYRLWSIPAGWGVNAAARQADEVA